MSEEFYNVKTQKRETVNVTEKVIFGDSKRARYAFKAIGAGGTKLTKFVSKDKFDAADVPMRDDRK